MTTTTTTTTDPSPMSRSTERRVETLLRLTALGFHPAPTLPVSNDDDEALRPAVDVARRALAVRDLFFYVAAPSAQVPTGALLASLEGNDLKGALTDEERAIVAMTREAAHEAHEETIGWHLESLWVLAWVLGFPEVPGVDGEPVPERVTGAVLGDFLRGLGATEAPSKLLARTQPRALDEVLALEDLLYCAHDAARAAALGQREAIPAGCDPERTIGVLEARRQALTWALSPGVAWDETDLDA